MNWNIKHPQAKIDANNKRLANLPDANDSDENSSDPSESIKGKKDRGKMFLINDLQGESIKKRYNQR